jgi:carboxylesterase
MQPDSQIIPTAEPFFLPGKPGQPGCLLIHGFTGAPKEMRQMGEYLGQQGYPSLGIRLAGHATRPEDMIRSRYTDWIASVEDGYNLLCDALSLPAPRLEPTPSRGGRPALPFGPGTKGSVSGRIYLIGLSMGGVLSLLMSTRLDVAGVVAMSTPYRMPYDYPVWMMKLLNRFIQFQPKSNEKPSATWFDKDAYAQHISYPQNPVRSGAELKLLLAEMRAALPQVSVPVLLIHSKNDTYVLPENLERIYADLGASDKTKLYITGSGHVVTRDAAREQVFEAASAFIRRTEAAA